MSDPSRPRVTAADRAQRRLRIFARLQAGWSYEAIAQEENLSRERIRQIVKQTLDRREVDPEADFVRLQIARLDPALRLAAEKIAAGDLRAIDRLLRVLDRMDEYHSRDTCQSMTDEEADAYDEDDEDDEDDADDESEPGAEPAGRLFQPDENGFVNYRKIVCDKLDAIARRRAENAEEQASEAGDDAAAAARNDVAKFFPTLNR
ncbi:MAG TPA: sigma factor-like helix-turn-helix DNA-binding protein [Roseiarcus sp.]|nr:sigma factor-like helix-turn-helix DNA-binding protein [Roseiarcus sp.]